MIGLTMGVLKPLAASATQAFKFVSASQPKTGFASEIKASQPLFSKQYQSYCVFFLTLRTSVAIVELSNLDQ